MCIICAMDMCLCVMCVRLRTCTMNRMCIYVYDLCGEYVCV